jgi:predicted lactoylglutathione lyase
MKSPIRNNLIVELHVPDFNIAKDFYFQLGFKIISEDLKGNYPGYLVIQREDELGNTILNFYGDDERVYQQSYFKKFSPETPRGYEVEITIPVYNIKNLYEHVLKNLSTNIVQELVVKKDVKTTWYDFRLVDPFGFYIRITELID